MGDMSEKVTTVLLRIAVLSLVVVPILLGLLIVRSDPIADDVRISGTVSYNEPESSAESDNSINLWFQPTGFDAETAKARFNVYPWPTADLAVSFSSSTISDTDFELFVDELHGAGSYEFRKNVVIGALDVEFDVLSSPPRGSRPDTFFYPFDSYILDTYAGVSAILLDGSRPDRPAFDFFYDSSVSGFRLTYTRIAGWEHYGTPAESDSELILKERRDGNVSFLARFDRTWAVRFAVLMMIALWVVNCFAVMWTTYGVLAKKRPPSIQALIWAAASVLGSLQIRELFPGRPPLGIAIDYFFFFPALVINMLVVIVITASWSRRTDFKL